MNRDQEQEELAQADRHMAELKAHIVRQRLILGRVLAEGRRLLVAKSTLQAFEESLRIFRKHCEQILERCADRKGASKRPDPPHHQWARAPRAATPPPRRPAAQ